MNLSRYVPETYPHQWLPESLDLKTWERIEPWYLKLMDQPIKTATDLEQWVFAAGELNAAVSQEGNERHIAYTCQTDDPAREAAYLEYVREIEPKLKPIQNAIRNRYLDSEFRSELPRDRYFVFDRALENRRVLFREANIARETRLDELKQQYQKIIGAMTVTFRGEERTLAQMAPFLEGTDASVRREAWELSVNRRLEDRHTLDQLFDQMKQFRIEIAGEAGFPNFVEYAFRDRERFDYGIDDSIRFQKAVERVVVPLSRQIQEKHRAALGTDVLRPWDLSVDPLGRPPLQPFQDVEKLAAGTESIFREVDPDLGAQFAFLRSKQLLDLANRKGKAPGGYQTTLEDVRLPFIFMNAVGLDSDVRTLLHEGGHAFHTLACRGEPLSAYRDCPLEFCEVASMTMELLGARCLDPFYNDGRRRPVLPQAARGHRAHPPLDRHGRRLPALDLYETPITPSNERRAAWKGLLDRFGGLVDWSGYEEARDHSWHRQLHIFLYPFYYIEYGIAQLGALQIWQRSLSDPAIAVADYRKALAPGRLSTAPGTVRRGRHPVRLQGGADRFAHGNYPG